MRAFRGWKSVSFEAGRLPAAAAAPRSSRETAEKHGAFCVPGSQGKITTCRVCGGRAFKTMRGVELGDLCTKCGNEEERRRPTAIREFVKKSGRGDCSLLIRL